MTMYKLTAAGKVEKARQNYARLRQAQPPVSEPAELTLCATCTHRGDHPRFCQVFSPTGGENKAGFLIVVSCDGYQEAA